MLKRKLYMACAALAASLAITAPAYARDYAEETIDEASLITFRMEATVPEDFMQKMEVYLDTQHWVMNYDALSENNGYSRESQVEPGVYKIHVVFPEDIADRCSAAYPETYDPSTGEALKITVTQAEEERIFDEREHDHENMEMEPLEEFVVPVLDYSNGSEECGTIHIISKTYGAINNAKFRLTGKDRVYDIDLNSENAGMVDLILPYGNYTESNSIKAELDEDVKKRDVVLMWYHVNDPANFRRTYKLSPEEKEITIDDLGIMMEYGNQYIDVDSELLFRQKMNERYSNALSDHYESKVNEALEEFRPELQTEAETPPAIAEAEEPKEDWTLKILFITIGAIFAVIGIVIIVKASKTYKAIKRRRDGEDDID